MQRNAQLLHEVADRIESEPDLYDQRSWFSVNTITPKKPEWCNTHSCIAGTTMGVKGAIDFKRSMFSQGWDVVLKDAWGGA